jgi:hypothetical protein
MNETDLLESHPRRLMPAWAHERSLMGVRAWHAQPDARSGSRWRRWVLIGGDAALALALAGVFYLATGVHYDDQNRGIALILLQTVPLALRRWRPVSVLAVVVAATLGTVVAEILALVILATMVLPSPNLVVVTASVLVAALALYPLRRRAQHAAKRRFGHRLPGLDKRSRQFR